MSDEQTNRPYYSVYSSRLHLASGVMRPKNAQISSAKNCCVLMQKLLKSLSLCFDVVGRMTGQVSDLEKILLHEFQRFVLWETGCNLE